MSAQKCSNKTEINQCEQQLLQMSTYENYSDVSLAYADGRQVVALNTVLGAAVQAAQRTNLASISSCSVLDAGCGTGNYALALAPFVLRVDAIDADEGMLDQGRAKQAQSNKAAQINFERVDLRDLTHLQSNSVELFNCAQVLHHLTDESAGSANKFDAIETLLRSFYRLLVPGGALVVHLTLEEQAMYGYWWGFLIPQACARFSERVPQRAKIEQMLCNAGFEQPQVHVELNEHLQSGAVYEQPYGPLEKAWRDTVSIWSLATNEEVANVCHKMRLGLACEKTDAAWRADVQRFIETGKKYGQNTVFVAFKPV